MGRPKKDIDPRQVEALAKIGCTYSEIASIMGCGKATLNERFRTEIDKGHEELKKSIRRMQLKAARGGNVAMLIWLGKQYLGQRDKQDVVTRDETPAPKVTELVVTTRAQAKAVMAQQSGNGNGNGESGNGDAGLPGAGRIPG